jgi:excisionase family DNA binding protein
MTLLTIREAAQHVGRTPATVRRYIKSGRLPAEKQIGKFGEEYRIRREDLAALGVAVAAADAETGTSLARREVSLPAPAGAPSLPSETLVPISLYNELLMKHEQMLVQYGMIRAGGQKLLEYKAESEAKDESMRRLEERLQALKGRAINEIRFLRRHLRQAEIEVEDRNIEIVLLQEKIKRLEKVAADAVTIDGFDRQVAGIRDKERAIAELEAQGNGGGGVPSQGPFVEPRPAGGHGDDH